MCFRERESGCYTQTDIRLFHWNAGPETL
uniref:Uncharacterized protein n=1 Tax=Arundo donax TaxID=35708 RepID=A0A0A8Y2D4_ARUDO